MPRHSSNGVRELTIREISSRSGVSEGTLRMWETRYSFPNPQRLASGHRRYTEEDLGQVRAVMRARAQGLSLPSAIEHARTLTVQPRPSVYSALRESFPHLRSQLLPRRALVAISHAIEDECCARAQRPLLIGCFQQERYFRMEEARWRELARTAEQAFVLASFPHVGRPRLGPVEVPVSEEDPMVREWALICDAPAFSACLVGWERPERLGGERAFETVWTVEPAVVRAAARTCCEMAARSVPELIQELEARLSAPAPTAGPDLRSAIDLVTRMVLYATQAEASN